MLHPTEDDIATLTAFFPKQNRTKIIEALQFTTNVEAAAERLLAESTLTSAGGSSSDMALIPYSDPSASKGKSGVDLVDLTSSDALQRTIEKSKEESEQSDLQKAIELSVQASAAPKSSGVDNQLKVAIAESLLSFTSQANQDPASKKRFGNAPVGLMNVGNTCYVNSLLQTYFLLPQFREKIVGFRPVPPSWDLEELQKMDLPKLKTQLSHSGDSETAKLKEFQKFAALRFVHQLQKLFAFLLLGQQSYQDPTKVLNSLVDEKGDVVQVGNQEDASEYNHFLIQNLEIALEIQRQDTDAMDTGTSSPALDFGRFFSGKSRAHFLATEQDGTVARMSHEEGFGQIIVDVQNHAGLYGSLDSYTDRSAIDSFTTPQGFHTNAVKEVWLSQLPSFLMFQLQRVHFSAQEKRPVKITSRFEFEPVIYMDRYMEENSQVSKALRQKQAGLKADLDTLEGKLQSYLNFKGRGLPLDDILRLTSTFVENFHSGEIPSPRLPNNKVLGDFAAFLETSITNTETQIASLKKQIEALRAEVDSVFLIPELKTKAFHLHAVLVHDGQAGLGHYWAFIKDWARSVWIKFNDTVTLEVDEDAVRRESFGGGPSSPTAYCLIYLDRAVVDHHGAKDTNHLTSLIPDDLKALVQKSNQQFEEEVKKWAENPPAPSYGPNPRPNTPVEPMDTSGKPGHAQLAAQYLQQWKTLKETPHSDPRISSVHMYAAGLADRQALEKYLEKKDQEFVEKIDRDYTSFLKSTFCVNQALKSLMQKHYLESFPFIYSASELVKSIPEEAQRRDQLKLLTKVALELATEQTIKEFKSKSIAPKDLLFVGKAIVSLLVPMIPDNTSEFYTNICETWVTAATEIQAEGEAEQAVGELIMAFMGEFPTTPPETQNPQRPEDPATLQQHFTALSKNFRTQFKAPVEKFLKQERMDVDTDDDLPSLQNLIGNGN